MHGKLNWIPEHNRSEVSINSKGICYWCGKKAKKAKINKRGRLVYYDNKGQVFHIDHKKPLFMDGKNNISNLVLACKDCNLSHRKKKMANDERVKNILKEINKSDGKPKK